MILVQNMITELGSLGKLDNQLITPTSYPGLMEDIWNDVVNIRLTGFTSERGGKELPGKELPLKAKMYAYYMSDEEVEKDGVGDGEDGGTFKFESAIW